MQPAALELLDALSTVLDRWGRWYLFGARFARDMEAAGFELRFDDPEFPRRTRVLPFVHGATGMPLDVVLAGSGL